MKNRKALFLLLGANAISSLAQGISMLAIPWYFAAIIDETASFGFLYLMVTVATFFWSLFAGAIIDRYSRKRIFIVLSLIGLVVVGSISGSGFINGGLSSWLIGTVFCFTMLIFQIHYPNLYALAQEMSDDKSYGRINALLEIQGQATRILSGACAALLLSGVDHETMVRFGLSDWLYSIEPWEMHEIFLIDAITYVLALLLIVQLRFKPVKPKRVDKGKVSERIRAGMGYLKRNKALFIFGNCSYAIFAIIMVEHYILHPMYVDNHLQEGAGIFSLSKMLYASGALVAGLFIRRIFKHTNYVKGIIILLIMVTVLFVICSLTNSIAVLLFFSILTGLGNSGARVLRVTFLFEHIPNHMIGRVISVFQMINIFFRFSFILLFSMAFFAEGNQVIYAYLISGIFIGLNMLGLVLYYRPLMGLQPAEEPKVEEV